MSYSNIYFLYIPKTGGRYLIYNILDKVYKKTGINHLGPQDNHYFWKSEISDKTYLISLMRNPISHMASLYAHSVFLDSSGVEKQNFSHQDISDLCDEKRFVQWVIENRLIFSNFQSKSFLAEVKNKDELVNFGKINISTDSVLERINRINLLVKSEFLKEENNPLILNKILKDFNVEPENNNNTITESFYNKYTKTILSNISDSSYELISKISNIDYNIYEKLFSNTDLFVGKNVSNFCS